MPIVPPPRARADLRGLACAGVVLALALAGCGPDPIDPERIEPRVVGYGEFEIRDGQPVRIASSERIACEVGRLFGVDYEVGLPPGSGGPVPVQAFWVHPPLVLEGARGPTQESAGGPRAPLAPVDAEVFTGRSLWAIARPEERRSGRYEWQLRRTTDGRVLLARSFALDCDGPDGNAGAVAPDRSAGD